MRRRYWRSPRAIASPTSSAGRIEEPDPTRADAPHRFPSTRIPAEPSTPARHPGRPPPPRTRTSGRTPTPYRANRSMTSRARPPGLQQAGGHREAPFRSGRHACSGTPTSVGAGDDGHRQVCARCPSDPAGPQSGQVPGRRPRPGRAGPRAERRRASRPTGSVYVDLRWRNQLPEALPTRGPCELRVLDRPSDSRVEGRVQGKTGLGAVEGDPLVESREVNRLFVALEFGQRL